MKPVILISACLHGQPCRYDGKCNYKISDEALARLAQRYTLLDVCPEVLAGLPTPRTPCEIEPGRSALDVIDGRGRVLSEKGEDRTGEYLLGARKALQMACQNGARVALLKEGSPSCGAHRVYDGTFGRVRIPGMGVTAQMLFRAGITVLSEDDIASSKELL